MESGRFTRPASGTGEDRKMPKTGRCQRHGKSAGLHSSSPAWRRMPQRDRRRVARMSYQLLNAVLEARRSDLSPAERHVLLVLAWRANAEMECWPSEETIMADTGLSKSTVQRALKRLMELGVITVIKSHRATNRYTLAGVMVTPEKSQDDADPVSQRHLPGVMVTPGRCHGDTPTSKEQVMNKKGEDRDPVTEPDETPGKGRKRNAERFVKPTAAEVKAYVTVNGYPVDADQFVSHYESNGWKVGKNAMKDWQAAVRTWAHRHSQGDLFAVNPGRKPATFFDSGKGAAYGF